MSSRQRRCIFATLLNRFTWRVISRVVGARLATSCSRRWRIFPQKASYSFTKGPSPKWGHNRLRYSLPELPPFLCQAAMAAVADADRYSIQRDDNALVERFATHGAFRMVRAG